mmetsp:Transcript_19403/g.65774  ORF Transcript_19403/g.65774 Transcript_19403/m.65774 type:complete len:210 (+) Transcript_19403:128-757(+)
MYPRPTREAAAANLGSSDARGVPHSACERQQPRTRKLPQRCTRDDCAEDGAAASGASSTALRSKCSCSRRSSASTVSPAAMSITPHTPQSARLWAMASPRDTPVLAVYTLRMKGPRPRPTLFMALKQPTSAPLASGGVTLRSTARMLAPLTAASAPPTAASPAAAGPTVAPPSAAAAASTPPVSNSLNATAAAAAVAPMRTGSSAARRA